MSDENAKLIAEIIAMKEEMNKLKERNTELINQENEMKEQKKELTKKNIELNEQNVKLLQIIEELKNEESKSIASNPSSEKMLVEKSIDSESEEKIVAKVAERKSVPNWLIEVLAWIKRVEMANSKLSTSNWTFKQLCWPKLHGNVKPYNVGWLDFYDEFNETMGIYQDKLKLCKRGKKMNIPIASIPPPNYIIGFKEITIDFLDVQVMKFMECFHSILNDGISLQFSRFDVQLCRNIKKMRKKMNTHLIN